MSACWQAIRYLSPRTGVAVRNTLVSWGKLGERAKLSHEQIQGVRKMNQWSSCQLGVTLRALHRKSFSSGKVMTVLTILFLNGSLEMRRKKCAGSTFVRKVCKSREGGELLLEPNSPFCLEPEERFLEAFNEA